MMNMQVRLQTKSRLRYSRQPYKWLVIAIVLLLSTAVVASSVMRMQSSARPLFVHHRSDQIDPATQSVLNYLQAHGLLGNTTVDPNQQAVRAYLQIHGVELPTSTTRWHGATQAVFDSVRLGSTTANHTVQPSSNTEKPPALVTPQN